MSSLGEVGDGPFIADNTELGKLRDMGETLAEDVVEGGEGVEREPMDHLENLFPLITGTSVAGFEKKGRSPGAKESYGPSTRGLEPVGVLAGFVEVDLVVCPLESGNLGPLFAKELDDLGKEGGLARSRGGDEGQDGRRLAVVLHAGRILEDGSGKREEREKGWKVGGGMGSPWVMSQGGGNKGLGRASHLRFAFFSFFTFPLAIIPLLYFLVRERGLSRGDYATLQSIYYFSMVALELPTGWLADRIGRKIPLVLGPLFFSGGFFLMFVATDYQTFAIAELLQGAGHALLSGTPSALLYDTLLSEGRREEYLRLESSMSMWRTLGTALSFLAGGIIGAVLGLPAVALATSLLCLLGAGAALGLREAPREPEPTDSQQTSGDQAATRNTLSRILTVFRNRQVRWLLILYILLFFLLRFGFHTNQPWLEEAKKNGALFVGGLYFSFALVALPFTKLAPGISHSFGEVRTLLWLPVLMALSFLGLSIETNALLIPLFFLQQVSFGLHWPLVQSYANHRIPSRDRALALSVLSFGARLSFALGFPLVFSDGSGIQGIFFWVGVIALGLCLLGAFFAPGREDALLVVGEEP